jgi:hypothetical protein
MNCPRTQLTLGGIVKDVLVSATVTRLENGFDTATVTIEDEKSKNWTYPVTRGASVKLEVKDASETAYTTLLEGIIRQVGPQFSTEGELTVLKCDGAGYGLAETFCAQEYGTQSRNPTLDTMAEILTDANYGIVPKWVNKIRGTATDSGYAYTTTYVETITGTIGYIYFPYKPCNKSLGDLCDIINAIKAGTASAHWIVTPIADLRVKLIGASQVGWPKYYGGEIVAEATLEQGSDFADLNLQQLDIEANYVVYYGSFRRPCNGDSWTENSSSLWGKDATITISDEGGVKKVGSYSIKLTDSGAGGDAWVPAAHSSNMNISAISQPDLIPTVNFYALKHGIPSLSVVLPTGATDANAYYYLFQGDLTNSDEWYNISLPIGPYYTLAQTKQNFRWSVQGAGYSWTDIDAIHIGITMDSGTDYVLIDGLHIGNVPIIRIAKNSTNITANKLKAKLITDDTGKDDTLNTTVDGVMAQLAYNELLRCQTTPIVGSVTVPMIKDLLPGQLLHIHAKKKSGGTFTVDKDMRVSQVIQVIDPKQGFLSQVSVTDDLTNSHPRQAFTDLNKVMADMRPEFQDRQATAIKAGQVNINCAVFEKDYP